MTVLAEREVAVDPVLASIYAMILEEPDEDLHRRVYADRLEEMGDDTAMSIRCQLLHPGVWSGNCNDSLTPGLSIFYAKRRGFVESVNLELRDWLRHGKDLAKQHPLKEVEIKDANCTHTWERHGVEYRQGWFGTDTLLAGRGSDNLPLVLWRFLAGKRLPSAGGGGWKVYPSVADANADLSNACLLWAREEKQ